MGADRVASAPRAKLGFDCGEALAFGLFAIATIYLVWKVIGAAALPGYDFKYLWIAGRMWSEGLNPYGPEFERFAAALRLERNVPFWGHDDVSSLRQWPYPPNFWPLARFLGLFDVEVASAIWASANGLMVVGASALIASVCLARVGPLNLPARRLFFFHTFLMAALQATALTIVVGQTSILIYFAFGLVLFGLVKSVKWVAAIGFALLCLKPQIGAPLILAAFFLAPSARAPLAVGLGTSVIAAMPTLLASITAPLDWLMETARYGDAVRANAVGSVTGIRTLAADFLGVPIGTLPAVGLALAVAALLTAWVLRKGCRNDLIAAVSIGLMAALAIAPLHLYDFVMVGAMAPFFLRRPSLLSSTLAIAGAGLLWRAEDIADVTGFHAPGVEIFAGSRLAAIGAALLLIGLIASLARPAPSPVLEEGRS
jgi:hypothetical protein